MTSKKITTKTIEQSEPALSLESIAKTVAINVVSTSMKSKYDSWETFNKEEKTAVDAEYLFELKRLTKYLVERAETTFQHNKSFHKSVLSKKNGGNYGRDYLYMFMYHWLGFNNQQGRPEFYRTYDYNLFIKNYERAKKAAETHKINKDL